MRIATLDILRFIAALMVVFYHYIPPEMAPKYPTLSTITQYGYLGVPLFFMISGYVITLSANNRTTYQFLCSRFVRLYPALWAGMTVTIFITSTVGTKEFSLFQILANATLLPSYLGFEFIDGVYWTLVAELKFYLIVSLLIGSGLFIKHKLWLTIWLVATLTWAITKQPFFMGWFISPSYSPYFIVGIALYFLSSSSQTDWLIKVIFVVAAVLCTYNSYYLAAGFIPQLTPENQVTASLLTVSMITLMLAITQNWISLPASSLALTLGALTYPLYLIHNYTGKALISSIENYTGHLEATLLITLLMLTISWLIYRFIEQPFATPLKNLLLKLQMKRQSTKKWANKRH